MITEHGFTRRLVKFTPDCTQFFKEPASLLFSQASGYKGLSKGGRAILMTCQLTSQDKKVINSLATKWRPRPSIQPFNYQVSTWCRSTPHCSKKFIPNNQLKENTITWGRWFDSIWVRLLTLSLNFSSFADLNLIWPSATAKIHQKNLLSVLFFVSPAFNNPSQDKFDELHGAPTGLCVN